MPDHSNPLVVIKLGSNSLVNHHGQLDDDFLALIASQVHAVIAQGWHAMLVSSGAVACGQARLGWVATADTSLSERQALAAVGQADLMHHWQRALADQDLVAAQLLLTGADFHDREAYVNIRSTLNALFESGAVPIINENDPISEHGISLGDNDRLSALVASMLEADRLIIATDIAGVYDRDPRQYPDAQLLTTLTDISHELVAQVGGAGQRGRGGMRSKVAAAATASQAGVQVHIALAREPDVIPRLIAGEPIGTTVIADQTTASNRRHWLANARLAAGTITIDPGAVHALQHEGSSLLPVGITAIAGTFQRGDTVHIVDPQGQVIARGLSCYDANDLSQILGCRRDEAVSRLGAALPKAAVHRNDLLLTPLTDAD